MQIPPFTLNRQFQEIGAEIESEVLKVLKGGQYIGGQEIAKFEESFSNLIGVENTIGCNSGTDALVLALRALEIGVGDEVITSSFSFFATAEAISAVGANPVLVDIDPETYLINTELIEQEINPNTKAIMPVHLFGNAVNMTSIKSLAKKYDLKVIEDCAQATCTMWENSKVGSIGDIGCFSFFPTKNLGAAGDGGAVTTSDEKIAKKIRELAVHGSPIRYHHSQIGYNSRLDTIQAAILNIKIKYISKWINNRKKIANNYLDLLEKNSFISFPKINSDSISHSWNQFVIKLRNDKYFLNDDFSNLFDTDSKKYYSLRNLVKQQLFEKGINSIIYYPIPIHAQIAYKNKNFSRTKLINTERICTEVISLPMFPEICYEEQVYVAENLNKVLKICINEIQISA
tara:strand:+ start:469 stop:1674 length:1206 start_codon:yes stop_codon:yes gene_type:complete